MTAQLPPLTFPRQWEEEFHQALMSKANRYLTERGDHRYADKWLMMRIGFLIAVCVLSYIAALWQQNTWAFVFCYGLFVISGMLLSIVAHHDATHNTVFRSQFLNRCLSRLVTLPLGADPDYWRVRHTEYHHFYANVEHYDLDTEENGFLRQTPYQSWKPYMRFQHLYWPLIAGLSLPYISWVFDWNDRLGKSALSDNKVLKGPVGWLIFLASKLIHLSLALFIPMMIAGSHGISASAVFLTYLLTQMFASLVVVVLLLGTHWAKAKFYQVPDSGEMQHGWYHHNFATACDWHTYSWLSPWFGGLNLHLTHHLFPGWSHRHYRALAGIVEDVSRQFNFPYRALSYREVFILQQRFLKAMGHNDNADSKGANNG